jgi:trk system potassium uptake protein TrkH
VWWRVFHSISAFCNAGFDILGAVEAGGSLMPFCTDPVINVMLMILIIVGGLGFFVWEDILDKRSFRKLTVYSRLVLIISGMLVVGGAVIFLLLEWSNPLTLGALTTPQKVFAGLFHSVSTRTAGFYTFPQAGLTDASKIVTDFLMLIGGSSGSTAGGIKTVTMGVLLLSVIATARGRSRLTVFHRTISPQQIRNAVSVVTMVFSIGLVSGMIVSVTNGLDVMDCLYETFSAIATVGLSTGITGGLNLLSKCMLIVLMFFGRVGVMTVSLGFLVPDQAEERYHFAETNLLIG